MSKIKVNKGDLALIQGSIKKWEGVVRFHESDGKAEDLDDGIGGTDCPLCCKYNYFFNTELDEPKQDEVCGECPIFKKTGRQGAVDHPMTSTTMHMNVVRSTTR